MMPPAAVPEGAVVAQGAVTWSVIAKPRKWSRIGLAAWTVGNVLGGVAMTVDLFPWMMATSFLSFIAYPLFIVSYVRSLTEATSPGAILVQGDLVRVTSASGTRELRARDVVSALVLAPTLSASPSLELRLADGDVLRLQSPDAGAASRIAQSLGFGPGGRSVEVDLARPIRRLLHLAVALALMIPVRTLATLAFVMGSDSMSAVGLSQAVAPALTVALYLLLRQGLRGPVVRVGDDGVLVRRGRSRRFVPRSDIASVDRHGSAGFVLRRFDGGTYVERDLLGGDAGRTDALAREITARIRAGGTSSARLGAFEKGDDAVPAWRVRVATSLEAGGYRDATSPVEEAHAVLRGGEATPMQRVGAALALRAAGEPAERIRVAADAVADERLRDALEAVAADDDLGLEKAIARLTP